MDAAHASPWKPSQGKEWFGSSHESDSMVDAKTNQNGLITLVFTKAAFPGI